MSLQLQPQIELALPPVWRKLFKTMSEMDPSPLKFLISGFLPEGITFIGGLSGAGKTWFAMSMAKAICTGEKFLGKFAADDPATVLYLVPESGERAFRQRMETMGIPDDERFLCRTMTDGPIKLDDPNLLEAVRHLKPVMFLDTAVRFNDSENENDASQSSRTMAKTAFALIKAGAKAIVCLHHSPKDAANKPATLENTLRGSGDLGAMADAVYSLKVEDPASLQVRVENVKARDFEAAPPFTVQGRPFITENADFGLITDIEEPTFRKLERADEEKFLSAIAANPHATYSELRKQLGMDQGKLQRISARLGWTKGRNTPWVKPEDKKEGSSPAR